MCGTVSFVSEWAHIFDCWFIQIYNIGVLAPHAHWVFTLHVHFTRCQPHYNIYYIVFIWWQQLWFWLSVSPRANCTPINAARRVAEADRDGGEDGRWAEQSGQWKMREWKNPQRRNISIWCAGSMAHLVHLSACYSGVTTAKSRRVLFIVPSSNCVHIIFHVSYMLAHYTALNDWYGLPACVCLRIGVAMDSLSDKQHMLLHIFASIYLCVLREGKEGEAPVIVSNR